MKYEPCFTDFFINRKRSVTMESIRELYRIGHGPSSSHTMGPAKAAAFFRQRFPQAPAFRIHFFGSLAATGKGHMTDIAIQRVLAPADVSFLWQPEIVPDFHPNGMLMEAVDADGQVLSDWEVFSVGGGALRETKTSGWLPAPQTIYEDATMN